MRDDIEGRITDGTGAVWLNKDAFTKLMSELSTHEREFHAITGYVLVEDVPVWIHPDQEDEIRIIPQSHIDQ